MPTLQPRLRRLSRPEKLDMVKNCKVTKDGNYVSLIVADNAAEILQKYQDSIK